MAYSELIKNFDRIRDYMSQFYIYGFKSRNEYDRKSARSYDNERRRIESWLGDYMRFRQTPEGKQCFLSVDSRAIPANPLYQAFKAKSFTAGDVTFHFYILDLLRDGAGYNAREITDLFSERYLRDFDSLWIPDLSTIRKKLREYVELGILRSEKRGKELIFLLNEDTVDLKGWTDATAFFSEVDPLGVVGSILLDRMEDRPEWFRFKHHYILHTLESRILLELLTAIGEKRRVRISNRGHRRNQEHIHLVCPLRIFISTQSGRQYLLCHHYRYRRLTFLRLDYIQKVEPEEPAQNWENLQQALADFMEHAWGVSVGTGHRLDHLELTLRHWPEEDFIPQRLERERRNGKVEILDAYTCRYTVDVYDASEMIPWLRTFIGRIVDLKCSDETVVTRFYEDLQLMEELYGGEA